MVSRSQPALAASDRTRSVAWPPFAERLAGALAALEEDQFLILSVKRSDRFVQFAAQGHFGMRAETTANRYLTPSERLDARQVAALSAAGWRDPTGDPGESTPEQDPDGSPNFFAEFPFPVAFGRVADLAVLTLSEILRIPHPGFLEYEAFDTEGRAILLPALGLKRAVHPAKARTGTPLPERLLAAVRKAVGLPGLDFDEDGELVIGYRSIVAVVGLSATPPTVRICAALLSDVAESPALLSRLNHLNARVRHLHFFWHDTVVWAVTDVPAEPFVAAHVQGVLRDFCQLADGIDGQLQAEFGGRTAEATTDPGPTRH